MPPNWTISTLGDATEMGAGGDKPKESSPVKTPLCPYPIYSNGINDYGLYGYTNDPKIKVESVTVSARGTIGYVCLRHTPYVPIVRLVTLIPDTKVLSAKYLYLYLRQLHITGTGTTQQQLTVPDFRKTEIIIPDKNTMDSFTETVTPLFEQIWANEDENTKLAEVRDALLPKLMSGEIDVSEGTGSVSAQDGECADCLQSFPFLRSKKSDVVHREIADCIVNRSYHRRIDSLEAKPFSAQGSTLCFPGSCQRHQ